MWRRCLGGKKEENKTREQYISLLVYFHLSTYVYIHIYIYIRNPKDGWHKPSPQSKQLFLIIAGLGGLLKAFVESKERCEGILDDYERCI